MSNPCTHCALPRCDLQGGALCEHYDFLLDTACCSCGREFTDETGDAEERLHFDCLYAVEDNARYDFRHVHAIPKTLVAEVISLRTSRKKGEV